MKILYWFVENPVRVGVYATKLEIFGHSVDTEYLIPTEYRYWDGENWHMPAFIKSCAEAKPVDPYNKLPGVVQHWAGLSEKSE